MSAQDSLEGAPGGTTSAFATNGHPQPTTVQDASPAPRQSGSGSPGEWLRLAVWGFAVYTVFLILKTASQAAWLASQKQPILWGRLIGDRALEEYTCALFFAPLFLAVRRWPLDRQHWQRNLPILLLLSLTFVLIKYAFILRPIEILISPATAPTLSATLLDNTVAVLIDFWTIIGLAHAVEFYRRAQARELVASDLRTRLSQAQLEVLRAQLHPHFLFNTLNSVATLVHCDADAADRMVTDLADLLRATLEHSGSQEIPLSAELDLLDRYVGIVRGRFRDRLTVEYVVPAEVRDALVPQFLLQPLVENALEHGIACRPGPGRVEICARRVRDDLQISVSDDGLGLHGAASNGHGVGLANMRSRLAGLYGAGDRVSLVPATPEGGAVAAVILPFRRRATPAATAAD